MKKTEMEAVELGTGRLSWSRYERIGDRYGSVLLFDEDGTQKPWPDLLEGQIGTLKAEILKTRESGHIGDLFRGLFPSTPEVGDIFELGGGELFSGDETSAGGVGVIPDDGRQSDWLDPVALYRCHDQTVRLVFEVKVR